MYNIYKGKSGDEWPKYQEYSLRIIGKAYGGYGVKIINDSALPVEMSVDYARVYKLK